MEDDEGLVYHLSSSQALHVVDNLKVRSNTKKHTCNSICKSTCCARLSYQRNKIDETILHIIAIKAENVFPDVFIVP